jgi:hypothetical protein
MRRFARLLFARLLSLEARVTTRMATALSKPRQLTTCFSQKAAVLVESLVGLLLEAAPSYSNLPRRSPRAALQTLIVSTKTRARMIFATWMELAPIPSMSSFRAALQPTHLLLPRHFQQLLPQPMHPPLQHQPFLLWILFQPKHPPLQHQPFLQRILFQSVWSAASLFAV